MAIVGQVKNGIGRVDSRNELFGVLMTQDLIVQVEFPQAGVGLSWCNEQGIF